MDRVEFHPLANLFPMMTDEEVNDLGDDMLEHGQREPIWKYEGMILDGRNRYNACLLKGIEPRFIEFRGADPVAFVVSLNLKRRHLDDAQRAMIAAKLATMKRGDNQHSPNGETSQAKAAKLLNVSKRRVERTREVIDKGVPDLVDAVEQGKVKVSAAAEFAKANPPLDQQRQIVEAGSAAAAVKAPRPDVKAKADRAANKTPKPVPPVKPAADRAEQATDAKPIDVEAYVAGFSDDDWPAPPTAAEARAAHLRHDCATRTVNQLKKVAEAFSLVRGAVPDPQISERLAAYADAVATIIFTIPNITDPKRTYEPCELNEAINMAAKRDKKFRDALNLTGFER